MRPRVAIACQGGGSHAVFVAGVLRRILREDLRERIDLVALSGCSGGAICAGLAWAGLVGCGPDDAISRLGEFWSGVEPLNPAESVLQSWAVSMARIAAITDLSPHLSEDAARSRLKQILEATLRLDQLPVTTRAAKPALVIGATDILSGARTIFHGETLTYDELLASAAVPTLFRAVRTHGTSYWDGMFSTNPPIRELMPFAPDELWVLVVNPQDRTQEPWTGIEIEERRNELAGNLSLAQELLFIDKMNELLEDNPTLTEHPRRGGHMPYKHITVRVLSMPFEGLDLASKLDRSPELLRRLIERGEQRAHLLFEEETIWPACGVIPRDAAHPNPPIHFPS
jgi:NTE family protein